MAVEAVPEQESVVGAGNMVIRDLTRLQMLQRTVIAELRPEQGFFGGGRGHQDVGRQALLNLFQPSMAADLV